MYNLKSSEAQYLTGTPPGYPGVIGGERPYAGFVLTGGNRGTVTSGSFRSVVFLTEHKIKNF